MMRKFLPFFALACLFNPAGQAFGRLETGWFRLFLDRAPHRRNPIEPPPELL